MNDCQNCDHKSNPQGGHCYMFKQEPRTKCMKFIPLIGVGAISLPVIDQTSTSSFITGATDLALSAIEVLSMAGSSVGDGICAVGEGAGAVISGIAECAGDILS